MQTYHYRECYPFEPWYYKEYWFGKQVPIPASVPLHPEIIRIAEAVAFQRAQIGSKLYKEHFSDVYALPEFQKDTRSSSPHLRKGWYPSHDPTCISDAVECFNATDAGKKLLNKFGNWNSLPTAEQSASRVVAEQSASRTLTIGTDCSGMEVPLMALRNMGIKYDHVFSSDNDPDDLSSECIL